MLAAVDQQWVTERRFLAKQSTSLLVSSQPRALELNRSCSELTRKLVELADASGVSQGTHYTFESTETERRCDRTPKEVTHAASFENISFVSGWVQWLPGIAFTVRRNDCPAPILSGWEQPDESALDRQ